VDAEQFEVSGDGVANADELKAASARLETSVGVDDDFRRGRGDGFDGGEIQAEVAAGLGEEAEILFQSGKSIAFETGRANGEDDIGVHGCL
jgi:hypothetical protein